MNGSFCNLYALAVFIAGCWAGVTYLRYTVLTSPSKGETALHSCDPALSVLVMLVSGSVFPVLSALKSIVFIHTFFLADQISSRSNVGSVIVCGPLQFALAVCIAGFCAGVDISSVHNAEEPQ